MASEAMKDKPLIKKFVLGIILYLVIPRGYSNYHKISQSFSEVPSWMIRQLTIFQILKSN